MKYRASIVILLLALSLPAVAQFKENSFGGFNDGSVSGVLLDQASRPAKDARIELRSTATGQVIASTYASGQGYYEFRAVPEGPYEIVAALGTREVRQVIEIRATHETLNLRLPAENVDAGDANTVSVAEFQVPKKARNHYKKAAKAYDKQKFDEAAEHLEKAIELHPEYAEALTLRGIMRLNSGKLEEARADLEAAIDADHTHGLAYFALGSTYNALQRYDDALRTIDRGVGLSPAAWQGYYEMGKAFAGKGDWDAALRQMQKAQALAPKTYAPIHLVKAHALLALKNYPEAMMELQFFLEQEPNGPDSARAMDTLARVKAFTSGGN